MAFYVLLGRGVAMRCGENPGSSTASFFAALLRPRGYLLQPFAQQRNRKRAPTGEGIRIERIQDRYQRAHVPGQSGQHMGNEILVDPRSARARVGKKRGCLVGLRDRVHGKNQTPGKSGAYIITQTKLRRRKIGGGDQVRRRVLADLVLQRKERGLAGLVETMHVIDDV